MRLKIPISCLCLISIFYTLEGEYPFKNEVNPDLPALTFDPFRGNDFRGYNMSDWVNPEAFQEDFDAENRVSHVRFLRPLITDVSGHKSGCRYSFEEEGVTKGLLVEGKRLGLECG